MSLAGHGFQEVTLKKQPCLDFSVEQVLGDEHTRQIFYLNEKGLLPLSWWWSMSSKGDADKDNKKQEARLIRIIGGKTYNVFFGSGLDIKENIWISQFTTYT